LTICWRDGAGTQDVHVTGGRLSVVQLYLDDNPTGTASDLNTISLTLTDDDTGTASASTSVTVNNVNPTLSNVAVSAATVNENGSITLTGSYADVGSQDTHTLTISWGDGTPAQTVSVSGGSFKIGRASWRE